MHDDIPIHSLTTAYNINVAAISHNNSYDFNTIHKHDYFEIMFFEKGGGYQLIDFNKVPIEENSCYIIKPKQLHLVKRHFEADGLMIQFTKEMLFSEAFFLLKNYSESSIVYHKNPKLTTAFFALLNTILNIQKSKSEFYKEKSIHLLSTLLYSLEENSTNSNNYFKQTSKIVIQFIDLVDIHINSKTINEYALALNVSSKKLTQLVKNELNTTPLKYIHNILILNIKRDLAFKELSHKEIAYNYNFDSPSNFSVFVKKQTGYNPSDLQKELIKKG
ncbi:AraC family transcriptional regulator [uncultured Tenacibaculum sp.]|uniref:AraC family transcriptional regulator n=1 Tax=uncultured Tenacibaculum sp. TaxID=174713 RepID=UPI002618EC22|nr:AraC family transcriptional regulator [uncultured Tenacibaculum sp.]